jgi:hypothetical protein
MNRIRKHLTTVVVAFVTASVAAGGTAAVAAIINADKLNGYAANQLVRQAGTNKVSTVDPFSGIATITTTTITAPKKGFLVVTASTKVDDSLGAVDAGVSCWLTLDGAELSSTRRTVSLSPGNALIYQTCGTNVAWPVGAGVHKVRLVGDANGLAAVFGPSNVSVLFEPFNGSGKVPTPLAPS